MGLTNDKKTKITTVLKASLREKFQNYSPETFNAGVNHYHFPVKSTTTL